MALGKEGLLLPQAESGLLHINLTKLKPMAKVHEPALTAKTTDFCEAQKLDSILLKAPWQRWVERGREKGVGKEQGGTFR